MENKKFNYTYSPPTDRERKEIENIRLRYGEPKGAAPEKSARLKKLDAHVKNTAISVAITVGVISTLVFGFGMSLVFSYEHPIIGTIVGLLGILGIIAAPLSYSYTLRYQKQKYGKEILDLAEQILNGEINNKKEEKI